MLWLLLLAFPAFSTVVADPACDVGYVLNGHWCYMASYVSTTYNRADDECVFDFAELVSIHDAKENDFVASIANGAFIGLSYKKNQFQWSDESAVDYKNLASDYIQSNRTSCTKIVDGVWKNADCTHESLTFVCKKAASNIPTTSTNVCPDANNIYKDYGELFSPGFPKAYNGSDGLFCVYRLQATEGDTAIVDFDEVNFDQDYDAVIRVYETWTASDDTLLAEVTWELDFPIEAKTSSQMLVVFNGYATGYWKATWYSDKSRPGTPVPGLTTTAHVNSPTCPQDIDYGEPQEAKSPNFPFAYEANFDCDYPVYLYFRKCPDDFTCQYTWQLIFEQLSIGSDDWIDVIDMGSNTVVESTNENIREGSVIDCPFNVTIRFHSGNEAGLFDSWRIRLIWEELEQNY